MRPLVRPLWSGLGLLATGLGIAGVVLPLLPATPFFLLAAFAFARSSPRLHAWLTGHRRFGPVIADWHRHGAIARRAKVTAVAVMVLTLAAGALAGLQAWLLGVQAAAMAGAAAFILSRPEPPRDPAAAAAEARADAAETAGDDAGAAGG